MKDTALDNMHSGKELWIYIYIYTEQNGKSRTGGVAQVVEHLLRMFKAQYCQNEKFHDMSKNQHCRKVCGEHRCLPVFQIHRPWVLLFNL
jgi:hypothetical protein